MTLNTSFYYEDWQHIQLEALPGDWALNINGNKARIYGGEVETRVNLGGGFQLDGDVGYTHARVDAGPHWQITPADKLSDVAPVNASVSLNYSRDIADGYTLTAGIDLTWRY